MTASYDRHGIAFLYPENWHISEEETRSQIHCVTLQSPGSAFWMLQVLQTSESQEQLVTEALRSVQQEYEDVEFTRVEEEIGSTRAIGYNMQFYCLDFLVSSHLRSFAFADKICVLLCQAEDHEFEQMALVFLAITTTLLQDGKTGEDGGTINQ